MKFRNRLIISYTILIFLPLVLLGTLFYRTTIKIVTKQAEKNLSEIVRKDNQIIDTQMIEVDHESASLITDKDLFHLFNTLNPHRPDKLLAANREITSIINKYFSQNPNVYTAQLWTKYYTFGTLNSEPLGNPSTSLIYQAAIKNKGKMVWYPTYDFVKMFDQPSLASSKIDYRYLFTATRLLNFTYIDSSSLYSLNPEVERPVLAVSFKENLFSSIFELNIAPRARYLVVSPSGVVVAGTDPSQLSHVLKDSWIYSLFPANQGTRIMHINGENMVVSFDRSKVTGWMSIVMIPQSELIGNLIFVIRTSVIVMAIGLGIFALILAYYISGRITGPIKHLMTAMKSVGLGDFHTQIDDYSYSNDEFGILIHKFNNMNRRIRKLVKENYEIKLREKDLEILMLNSQLNPHFLYNTLNILNWTAIENNQKELSKMLVCLSNMLHYTSRNEWGEVHLSEEIEWLGNYFFIMQSRFEEKFEVKYHIDPIMHRYKVPKLLFQPFVENAILHGFDMMESGGLITISGTIENNVRCYVVEDNGRGMDPETVNHILTGKQNSVGINNTISRIQTNYGDGFGVQLQSAPGSGTKVTITLPLNSE